MPNKMQLLAGPVTWLVSLPDGLAGTTRVASPESLQALLRGYVVCPADCRLDEGLRAFLRAVLSDEWLPL